MMVTTMISFLGFYLNCFYLSLFEHNSHSRPECFYFGTHHIGKKRKVLRSKMQMISLFVGF